VYRRTVVSQYGPYLLVENLVPGPGCPDSSRSGKTWREWSVFCGLEAVWCGSCYLMRLRMGVRGSGTPDFAVRVKPLEVRGPDSSNRGWYRLRTVARDNKPSRPNTSRSDRRQAFQLEKDLEAGLEEAPQKFRKLSPLCS
jgi:hypothetical protein